MVLKLTVPDETTLEGVKVVADVSGSDRLNISGEVAISEQSSNLDSVGTSDSRKSSLNEAVLIGEGY